jgi:two-component system sensor histidine kinase HydH
MTRLTAPLAAVSLLLLVLAGGAAWYVRDMQRTTSELLASNVTSVRAAQELEISLREVDSAFDHYLATGDRAALEPVPRLKQRTADALAVAEAVAYTPEEQRLMRQVRRGYERFFVEYESLLRHPPAQGLHPGINELSDTILEREILEPSHEYLRLNEEMLARGSAANEALAERLTTWLVALALCGSTGGLLGGWVIASAVRRSIRRTEERLRDAADRLSRAVAPGAVRGSPAADPLDRVSSSVAAVLARLAQSERDALRAEQLAWVGQIAAGIAHEVRNPLMAIKLLVQTAGDPSAGTGLRPRDLRVLEEEIARLERIVSGFLDFARPPRPDLRPVELGALLEQAVEGVRPRAEVQGVAVVVDRPAAPIALRADANQLRQVVYNLLFNALDAQPTGGRVRVTVAVEAPHPEADPAVVFRVEDDGLGLPPGLGDRVFEPFVSTKETGLGLGLSICRRIVESHGGTVRAADRPGGGAVFTVRLPARRAAAAPVSPAAAAAP